MTEVGGWVVTLLNAQIYDIHKFFRLGMVALIMAE